MIKFLKSFVYALKGIVTALRTQQNMRIHLAAVVLVTTAGIFLQLSAIEWSVIALTYGSVLVAEMVNTAFEILVDMISPEHNEQAGMVKDVAAGAVLLAAIIAAVVAVYIFGNKIFNLLL